MLIRKEQLDAMEHVLGRPLIQECPSEQLGKAFSLGPEDEQLLQCLLELCKTDRDVIAKAKKLKILARNPKKVDVYRYEGGTWKKRTATSLGTAGGGTVWVNRNLPCGELKGTIYHEVVHTGQPRDMPRPQKELEAYTKTEQWTIDRGLPSQSDDNSFRKRIPGHKQPIVNADAIEDHVRTQYGFNIPKGGPLPPQVVRYTDGGRTVIYDDGSSGPVFEGASFYEVPPQKLNEQQIPPERLTCP